MRLTKLKTYWEDAGKKDPFWAVLTNPLKRGNRWSVNEFYESGKTEIDYIMNLLHSKEIKVRRTKVLDFGCGVGRLSQALALYFDHVRGVDISLSMVEIARRHNKFPRICFYDVNDFDNLSLYKNNTFDMIYTNIVLQHIEPIYSLQYIQEFLRILKPGGVLLFQIPSKRIKRKYVDVIKRITLLRKLVETVLRRKLFDMYCIPSQQIINFLKKHNCKVIDIIPNKSAGEDFISYLYLVSK